MANPSGRKGAFGERCVRDHINRRFPLADQGIGATIIPSRGRNDIGDIDGVPHTMIEVKNHRRPSWGALLANAEWKAANAGRPLWALVAKRPGCGVKQVGRWDAVFTVSAAAAFGMVDDEGRLLPEVVSQVVCDGGPPVVGMVGSGPGKPLVPVRPMCFDVHVHACYTRIGDVAHRVIDEHPVSDGRTVLCVFPRRGRDVQEWFVFTSLDGWLSSLEAFGVVPPVVDA